MPNIHLFSEERLENMPPVEVEIYGAILKNFEPTASESEQEQYQSTFATIEKIQQQRKQEGNNGAM